jgi:hypothetical protein
MYERESSFSTNHPQLGIDIYRMLKIWKLNALVKLKIESIFYSQKLLCAYREILLENFFVLFWDFTR